MRRRGASLIVASLVVTSGFIALLAIMPGNATGATLHVGGVGSGNYTSIQAAIDAASPGDTIYIHNGIYLERIKINKSLSIVGEDRDRTVFDDTHYAAPAITANVSWVNISSISVTNAEVNGAVWIHRANNVTINDCRFIDNNTTAIMIDSSSDVRVLNNSVSNDLPFSFQPAIYTFYSTNVTIANNAISSINTPSIFLVTSTNVTMSNNAMTGGGIRLHGDSVEYWDTHNIDSTNTANGKPVYFWKDVAGGRVPDGAGQVILANVTGVVVENQNIMKGTPAISLGFSHDNVVSNNTFGTSESCILVYSSDDNTFVNNTAFGPPMIASGLTIILKIIESEGETLRGNQVAKGFIYIEGEEEAYWSTHSIDSSNRVNDKTMQYWSNTDGVTVPTGAGQVILANCTGMTVENQDIDGTYIGITLAFSKNNTIESNVVRDGREGLYLYRSEGNRLDSNLLSKNGYGIHLFHSNNNTITANTISENIEGLVLWDSHAIKVYHNNFINNRWQMKGLEIHHDWRDSILDDGYPSGGNYWSDYDGEDRCKGTDQKDCSGPDGIGDTEFRSDRYPLMEPYGSIKDGIWTTFASAIVVAAILMCAVLVFIVRRRRRKLNEISNSSLEQEPDSSDGTT